MEWLRRLLIPLNVILCITWIVVGLTTRDLYAAIYVPWLAMNTLMLHRGYIGEYSRGFAIIFLVLAAVNWAVGNILIGVAMVLFALEKITGRKPPRNPHLV